VTETTRSRSRLAGGLVNAALCLFVLALLFGAMEIFIRMTQPIAAAYDYAPCCDYVLTPGQTFRFSKRQFDTRITVNRMGLRGPLPDLTVPRRILILGDSFAFGYGVQDDESFPALLQARLGASAAVVNAGHSGYDTRRELGYLGAYGERFRPTTVIVAFVLNDVLSNPGKVWFNAVPDGWLRYFPLRATANFLSYLIRNPQELFFKLGLNDDYDYTSRDALACLRPDGCTEDWRITERYLRDIAAAARKAGARPLIVHVPVKEEIAPTPGVAYDPAGAERRLKAFGAAEGVPVVALRDALREVDYFPVDGHWTPEGHRRAAARIAAALNSAAPPAR
jgi:lysophospholipase L1-like esterase